MFPIQDGVWIGAERRCDEIQRHLRQLPEPPAYVRRGQLFYRLGTVYRVEEGKKVWHGSRSVRSNKLLKCIFAPSRVSKPRYSTFAS
jgi:hypothetical protein